MCVASLFVTPPVHRAFGSAMIFALQAFMLEPFFIQDMLLTGQPLLVLGKMLGRYHFTVVVRLIDELVAGDRKCFE